MDDRHYYHGRISRRKTLALVGSMSATPLIGCTLPKEQVNPPKGVSAYNLDDAQDKLQMFEKLRGDLSGQKVYSLSHGRVFGVRPDLKDDLNDFGKEVLRFTGCGMRIKRVLDNGNVETRSRSWLLYQDPVSGEFIDTITNPYTGEEVTVPPFRGGISGGIMTPQGPIVNANFSMESTAIGSPLNLVISEIGDRIHLTRHAFTKWLEKKTNTYRTEMTLDTFDFDKQHLYDKSLTHIPSDTHWTSQTAWLSLLNMRGTPGHMIWSSNSNILHDFSDLPQDFVTATQEKQPEIFEEPLNWDD
jgi:Protein of unknown function (DUF1838).